MIHGTTAMKRMRSVLVVQISQYMRPFRSQLR